MASYLSFFWDFLEKNHNFFKKNIKLANTILYRFLSVVNSNLMSFSWFDVIMTSLWCHFLRFLIIKKNIPILLNKPYRISKYHFVYNFYRGPSTHSHHTPNPHPFPPTLVFSACFSTRFSDCVRPIFHPVNTILYRFLSVSNSNLNSLLWFDVVIVPS